MDRTVGAGLHFASVVMCSAFRLHGDMSGAKYGHGVNLVKQHKGVFGVRLVNLVRAVASRHGVKLAKTDKCYL